jgi:metallothionein
MCVLSCVLCTDFNPSATAVNRRVDRAPRRRVGESRSLRLDHPTTPPQRERRRRERQERFLRRSRPGSGREEISQNSVRHSAPYPPFDSVPSEISLANASHCILVSVRLLKTSTKRPKLGEPMSDAKKCGNPACTCIPPGKEKFCSAHCEGLKGSVEITCQCGHPGCRGEIAKA